MLKAVIFDLDGVLADTVTLGRQARQKILAERYGIDLGSVPDPQGQDHRAASMKVLLESIQNHLGTHIDPEEFHQLEHEHIAGSLKRHLSADPALLSFLEDLKRHGVACAVVTTSHRDGAMLKLDTLGITQYFSIIITGDEIARHKPDPEAYVHALEKLYLPATDCIIFEDSLTGVQAGLAAGCKVINFTQYNPPKGPLPGVLTTVTSWGDISYKQLLSLEKSNAGM